MAKQEINLGTEPNSRNGDSLRSAFAKINQNFDELYTQLGLVNDPTLNLGAFEFTGSTMTTTDSTSIVIDQATTITSDLTVGGDIIPSVADGGNLGSADKPFRSLYVSNQTIYFGGVPLSLEPGTNELRIDNIPIGQTITFTDIPNAPTDISDLTDTQGLLGGGGGGPGLGDFTIDGSILEADEATIKTNDGDLNIESDSDVFVRTLAGNVDEKTWQFGTDGSLTLPGTLDYRIGENFGGGSLAITSEGTVSIFTNSIESFKAWTFNTNGNLELPEGGEIRFSYGYIDQDENIQGNALRISGGNNVVIKTDEDGKTWEFSSNGALRLPEGGDILDSSGDSVLGGGVAVLEDDKEIKVTVGNTEYFAIVNRAQSDGDDGVKSSGVAYDSEGNMVALHVVEKYIASTQSNIDILVISKFDNVGDLIWQKQIVEDVDVENDHDLVIDADDNIIVAVSKDRPGPDTIVVIKFGADGTVLWQKDYASTETVNIIETDIYPTANTLSQGTYEGDPVDVLGIQNDYAFLSANTGWLFQESADGTTWTTLGTVVGVSEYLSGSNTTQLYFAPGDIEVTLDYPTKFYRLTTTGFNSSLEVTAMALSGADIVVAAEYVENTNNVSVQGLLMKVSSTGTLQWARTFEVEAPTNPYGMDVGADGDIVVVGAAFPDGLPTAAFAQKFDGDTGAAVWTNILFGPYANNSNEYAGGDVVIDSQNNIFITVNSRQSIVHDDGNSLNTTISHVMKLNSAGATQWCRRIGPGPCASVATGIDCDDQGNVYLAALTVVQNNPVRDISEFFDSARNVLAVAKYSTAGAVLWQRYIESESYIFYPEADNTAPGNYDATTSRGRNMSIGPNGKLAIQVSARNIDPDDYTENNTYWESITFQIDQDGREMTVGSGNEKFTVKASRIPARFVTIPEQVGLGGASDNFAPSLAVTTPSLTFEDGELAQQIVKSAPYEYVFGNDGTLTIPNDGDIKLTQTQIGWFSIFGPANNDLQDIWIRANCVDPTTGDVYVVGQDDDSGRGLVARYNSEGEVLWSIRLFDDNNSNGTRCNAVKIDPDTGDVVVLAEYFGNNTGVLLVRIDPDTARIESEVGFRDLGEDSGVNAYDFDFVDTGDSTISVVIVGRKYDEWRSLPVTPLVGSTTGTIIAANASLSADLDTGWRVSGTGITGRVDIQYFNKFENLTSTVREGSGAQFQVVSAGDGVAYVSALATVPNKGTNYLVGHKIKILGTDLGGATPANDAIIEVTEIGAGGSIEAVTVSGTAGDLIGVGGTYNGLTGTNYNVGSGFAFSDFYTPYDVGQTYENNNGYTLTSGGTNYVVGDVITVTGTQLGGTSPANNMTLTVTDAPGGSVNNWTYSGTPQFTNRKITVNSAVDFSGVGSWNFDQPLGGEAFVAVGGAETFELQWTKVLSAGGESDTERYLSVAVDSNNNIYAAGEMIARNNAAGADINNDWCAVVSKFNSAGTHQWTRALNTGIDNASYAKCVAVHGNSVVVTHENNTTGTTVVTKLDATGAVKWQRQTNTGDDSSVAIDTNGDVYVVAEAFMESDYGNCVKVIKFNSAGEIVWRKILATQLIGYDNTSEYFKNGRNLTLDTDHLYISGYTTAYDNNFESGFLVKIPKSGDQDGVYDVWVIQQDTYDVDKITATEATTFTPVVGTGEFELWEPDFASEWWDPTGGGDYYHKRVEMRDRDGGAIEFADGTRQTTSAQQIPQIRISNGADHRLCLDDMGKHIYVTNGSTRIAVPYHVSVPLPIGYTVVIINNSGNIISIDADGGGIDIIVPGVQTAQYWDLASPGMATLIKVNESTWFMTGNVTVD